MEIEKLTEEQQKQFRKLHRSLMLRMVVRGVKFGLISVAASLLVALLDVYYVHSETFLGIGGIVTGIMIFRSFLYDLIKEHDRLKEEIDKILNK